MANPKKESGIALRYLKLENFKAFDSFEINFPAPRMKDDPDIFVLGSKNGLGKTSVLEACALLFLCACSGKKELIIHRRHDFPIDLTELLIRAGKESAIIEGMFDCKKEPAKVKLKMGKNRIFECSGDLELFKKYRQEQYLSREEIAEYLQSCLAGLNSDPLVLPPFMYFHSYRKVQEGNPEFGMMVSGRRYNRVRFRPGYEYPISTFKLEILRSMMGKAELFETLDDEKAGEVLEKLNELVKKYAGGTISKLRPSPDNTIDFRIVPTGGGESFTFDGLSSGQKEIISTHFLIWYYTRQKPGIVLIDEPELHLNAEWHRDFIRQAHTLVPGNQYILATHSEDVFASVPEDRRALLVESPVHA
ncbi:MAG: AAA family ATPase [bacterium]